MVRADARQRRVALRVLALAVMVAGCTSAAASPAATTSVTAATPTAAASGAAFQGSFDVGGYKLWIDCLGSGSPTVLFESGLNNDSSVWIGVQDGVKDLTRTCRYDRASLGNSDLRPDYQPRSAGQMADELGALLTAAGVQGPYVLVGHSYGGMIARAFSARHAADVAGLVFVDSATEEQMRGSSDAWIDGATHVDTAATVRELDQAGNLGARPTVVLTQGGNTGDGERFWAGRQDFLAGLSTNSLHMIARHSGHPIHQDDPKLVVAAVRDDVSAVRTNGHVSSCGPVFTAVDAECLDSTYTALLDEWDRIRAAVAPKPGPIQLGTYHMEIDRAAIIALTGSDPGFLTLKVDITLYPDGTYVAFVTDSGSGWFTDRFSSTATDLTFRIPLDWKVPQTPGLNHLRWTADRDGALHFTQVDGYAPETLFAVPWTRTGGVPAVSPSPPPAQ